MAISYKNISASQGRRLAQVSARWQRAQAKASSQARKTIAQFRGRALTDLDRRWSDFKAPLFWQATQTDSSTPGSAQVALQQSLPLNQENKLPLKLSQPDEQSKAPSVQNEVLAIIKYYSETATLPAQLLNGEVAVHRLKQIIRMLIQTHDYIHLNINNDHNASARLLGKLVTVLSEHYDSEHYFEIEAFLMKVFISGFKSKDDSFIAWHIERCIRKFFPRDRNYDVTKTYLPQIVCNSLITPNSMKVFLFVNHQQLLDENAYYGFLDCDWFKSEMRTLGLSEDSINGLVQLSLQKHFYKKADNLKIFNRFISLIRAQKQELLDYVQSFLPQLSSSRKSADEFMTWIKSFVLCSKETRNKIVRSHAPDNKLSDEISDIHRIYKHELTNLIYATSQKYNVDSKLAKELIDDQELFNLLVQAMPWLSKTGKLELQTFIKQALYSLRIGKPYKEDSSQIFEPEFLQKWYFETETPYSPDSAKTIDRFLLNARKKLSQYFPKMKEIRRNLKDHPNADFERHFSHIQCVNTALQNCNGTTSELQNLQRALKKCCDELRVDIVFLRRLPKTRKLYKLYEYLKQCLKFLDQALDESHTQDNTASYKLRITSQHDLMLRTGEEPWPNCLSLRDGDSVNTHGISFKRTFYINYKTFVLLKETETKDEIQVFADMEIRQYESGPVLIVDQFYLADGFIDEESLKDEIYQYAQEHLGLDADQVYFPDREHELPGLHTLKIRIFALSEPDKSLQIDPETKKRIIKHQHDLKVYRDHFKVS